MEIAKHIVAAQLAAEEIEREKMFTQGLTDEDVAEDTGDDPRDSPTSTFGWDRKADLLAQINDTIKVLTSTLVGVNLPKGKRPPKVKPTPRPVTAVEALRRRHEREAAADAMKQLGF